MIYHGAVSFCEGQAHNCSLFALALWSPALPHISTPPAGDFCSADDGSRGTAVALGDLHTDSRPACGTGRALLLAKGTAHLMGDLFIACILTPENPLNHLSVCVLEIR